MSDANIWDGPTTDVPIVNSSGNFFEEVQVATGGQTVFTLTTFQYTVGTKTIEVLRKSGGIGAQMLRRAVDYTETDSTHVTLAAGATNGDLLIFRAFAVSGAIVPTVFSGLPVGGTANQVLTKTSGSDYAAAWTSLSNITTLLDAARVNIASASTVDLSAQAATTRNIQITGTTQIDGFQVTNGQVWLVKFSGALTLKNNASIVTQSGYDIKVAPGDTCIIRATADNVVEVLFYAREATSLPKILAEHRLSTVSGDPVGGGGTTSTLYYTAYLGNKISLYNGTSWVDRSFSEINLALAGLAVNRPYDVFCYDNAGTATLELLAWTNDTTRATALSFVDNVRVKSTDTTRRYVGTIYTTAANQTADEDTRRFVWNMYNRLTRKLFRAGVAGSWTFNTAAYRIANGDVNNCVQQVVGVLQDVVDIAVSTTCVLAVAGPALVYVGIGLGNAVPIVARVVGASNAVWIPVAARYSGYPVLGLNTWYWLEQNNNASNITFYGGGDGSIAGVCIA